MRLPFGSGDWRDVKLASHFINLISVMGLDRPRPLRNFRNEGLMHTRLRNTKCVQRSLETETDFKRLFSWLKTKQSKTKVKLGID